MTTRAKRRILLRTHAPISRLVRSLVILAIASACPAAAKDIEVRGKNVVIYAPASEQKTAERLLPLGDAAIEMYAKDLGVAIPKQPFQVFLFATEEDYARAEEPRTHGVFKSNLAFCHSATSDILMCIQPRPGRPPGNDEGMLESLFTHELVHAIQYKYYPSFDDQPDWLSEGLAEAWSERAMARGDKHCADRSAWYGSFILEVREALHDGRYIPVEKLLTEVLTGHEFAARQLRYSESFALVRLLDSPDPKHAERRKKFRAFLREALAMPGGPDMPQRVNAKLKQTFGSLVPIERELVQGIMEEKVFPWHIIFREVRPLEGGALLAESFPASNCLAISSEPAIGPLARVKAEIEVLEVGTKGASLAFGYRGRTSFYTLAFGPGYCVLWRNTGKWEKLAEAQLDPKLWVAPKHTIQADIDGARVYAKLDGKTVLTFTLPEGSFPIGKWGVGAYDARIVFRNIEGKTF